jgi:hypothetical protein
LGLEILMRKVKCQIFTRVKHDRRDMPQNWWLELIDANHRDHTDHVDCIDRSSRKNDRSTSPSQMWDWSHDFTKDDRYDNFLRICQIAFPYILCTLCTDDFGYCAWCAQFRSIVSGNLLTCSMLKVWNMKWSGDHNWMPVLSAVRATWAVMTGSNTRAVSDVFDSVTGPFLNWSGRCFCDVVRPL